MVYETKRRLYAMVHVKPYAYRWLTAQFQLPREPEGCISLRGHRLLSLVFGQLLQHKTRFPAPGAGDGAAPARWRTREVRIDIGPHDQAHHGIDLTPEGRAELATLVEAMCQEDFRQFFVHAYMVEPRVGAVIARFCRLRGYSEEDWPQESLQKIVTRSRLTARLRRQREEYLQQFDRLFTADLSAMVDTQTARRILSRLCEGG